MDSIREKDEINGGYVAKTNGIFAGMFSAHRSPQLQMEDILVNIIIIDRVG